MKPIMDGYDRPGSWLADHPGSRRAVARLVAGLAVAAVVVPTAAGAVRPLPGGVSQYGASVVAGNTIRM